MRRRWELILATVGGVGIAVFVAAATVTALPPVLANLASVVSAGQAFPIGTDAEVTVPAGWTVQEGATSLRVRTPDGVMSAQIALDPLAPDAALESLTVPGGEGSDPVRGPVQTETLASGLVVLHRDVSAAEQGVVAAVGLPGGASSVTIVAGAGESMARYRPALADLLERIRVA